MNWGPDRVFDQIARLGATPAEVVLDEVEDENWTVVAAPQSATPPQDVIDGDLVIERALGEGRLVSLRVVGRDVGPHELYGSDGLVRAEVLVLRPARAAAPPTRARGAAESDLVGDQVAVAPPLPTHCFELATYRSMDFTVDSARTEVTAATATSPPVFSFTSTRFRTIAGLDSNFATEFQATATALELLTFTRGRQLLDTGYLRVDPTNAARFQVRVRGLVCHPSRAGYREQLPAGTGKLPIAILVHGNHASLEFTVADSGGPRTSLGIPPIRFTLIPGRSTILHDVPSYRGYRYLQEHLAQMGIVSVSIDTNAANASGSLVALRADLVLEMLDHLKTLDGTTGHAFHNRLDFSRVALVGHSRGGDAVAMAADRNRTRTRNKHGICAVVAIAPTDLTGMLATASRLEMTRDHTASFLCVYGSHDGDVSGRFVAAERSPGWGFTGTGFRHYDRATAPRAMVFIHGATHNRFNTIWIDPAAHRVGTGARRLAEAQADSSVDEAAVDPRKPPSTAFPLPAANRDARVLADTAHRTLAREYVGGWLALWLLRQTAEQPRFVGAQANTLGALVALQWKLGSKRRSVDNFDDSDPTRNVAGGATTRPPFVRERLIELADLAHTPHHDRTLEAELPTGASRIYRSELPTGARDWSRFTTLTFRISKRFPDVSTPTAIAAATFPPTLQITLFDGTNRRSVDQSVIAPLNPLTVRPYHRLRGADNLTKVHLQTWQVPLSQFTGTGGVSLSTIRAVEIGFDAGAGEPIHLDTLSVVRI